MYFLFLLLPFKCHNNKSVGLSQCSPWPEITYVNNSPSPGFNSTQNSFPVAEGYVCLTVSINTS